MLRLASSLLQLPVAVTHSNGICLVTMAIQNKPAFSAEEFGLRNKLLPFRGIFSRIKYHGAVIRLLKYRLFGQPDG